MTGRLLYKILVLLVLLGIGNSLHGQQSARHPICLVIPEVAIVDIEPNNTAINLQLEAPLEGGNAVAAIGKDQTKWINYTSAITRTGSNRIITAQIANGAIPEGVALGLIASGYEGSGKGAHGQSSGQIFLSSTPKTIIGNIGRSFTGNGAGNGHKLTYSLSILDYKKLDASATTEVTVIYTITE